MPDVVKTLRLPTPELPPEALVLAVDIGASNIRTAVVQPDGTVRHRRATRTPDRGTADDVLHEISGCLRATLAALGAAGGADPIGIGVSAVGPIDLVAGAIEAPANLPSGMHTIPVVGHLRREFGLRVVMERDTNVAALGEATFGAARGERHFVYLTVSTGIGASIVEAGRFLSGVHGLAGELGHVAVDFDGPLCGCGQRGCVEALASGAGIAAAAAEAIAAGNAPSLDVLARQIAPRRLEARDVAEAADHSDPVAQAILERARSAFAAAAVGIVNIFNPSCIVVGGSVAQGQGQRLLDPTRTAIARLSYGSAARATRVVLGSLGDDAGLAGCVPLVAALMT